MQVAYFVNLYPAVSHTFIRREILELEKLGVSIERIALRGWEGELVDPIDFAERERTQFLLRRGLLGLMSAVAAIGMRHPRRLLAAARIAWHMGGRGGRGRLYHLVYLAEACALVETLRGCDAVHVHAHFGTNSAAVVMLSRMLGGPPYSFTVHGPDEFDMPRQLSLGEKVGNSTFVAAISSYARAQLYRWVALSDWDKIRTIGCGVDGAYLNAERVPIPEAPRLVCIGRLSEQKGQLLLIEAVRRLKAKGMLFEVLLIGDGPLRGQLELRIGESGLDTFVKLVGSRSQEFIRTALQDSRGLVLPSFAEGLPVVIMESMALFRPVLSTYIAAIPELVRDGEHGWLIPAGDVDALAASMEEMLTAPVQRLEVMGSAAHERVAARHDVAAQAHLLKHAIAHNGAAPCAE
ncbi:MAG: glycosyltransferase family 4 protein [Pseudomonadales bacterium]|nr:glycosyltransferase family 4 protein [Pseudomonadales bacterium]